MSYYGDLEARHRVLQAESDNTKSWAQAAFTAGAELGVRLTQEAEAREAKLRAALEYVRPFCKGNYRMPVDIEEVLDGALQAPKAVPQMERMVWFDRCTIPAPAGKLLIDFVLRIDKVAMQRHAATVGSEQANIDFEKQLWNAHKQADLALALRAEWER